MLAQAKGLIDDNKKTTYRQFWKLSSKTLNVKIAT